MSLRRRVLVGFLVVATALVGTNALLSATFHSYLLDRLDRQLVAAADRFSRAPSVRRTLPPAPDAAAGNGQALTEFYVAQANNDGTSLAGVGAAIDTSRSDPAPAPKELTAHVTAADTRLHPFNVQAADGDHAWRVVAVHDASVDRMLVVGVSMDELDATLWRMRLIQVAGTLTVLTALAGVLWWILRLGVRPLASMAETADAIAGGDLSRRVDHTNQRTEAGRLGAALNTMLEKIEEAFRQRQASEANVRQFAADASHELRTPLTSILGYAQLWRSGGLRSEGELDEAMRRTEEEATRMAALVADLLLLARLDQGRAPERSPVRLDQLAADAVADARAVEPDRPITARLEPVTVDGDEMQLRQVVGNLVGNARVHTPPGTPVIVRVSSVGPYARLEVIDEGPGLPPGAAGKVFDRFFRGDPTRSRADGGSGLGLAIVAAVATAHDGTARVEPGDGCGCRFVVDLPQRVRAGGQRGGEHGESQEVPYLFSDILEKQSP